MGARRRMRGLQQPVAPAGAGAGAGAGAADNAAAAAVVGTDLNEATDEQLVTMEQAILTFVAEEDETRTEGAASGETVQPLSLTCVSAANDEGWTPLMFCAQVRQLCTHGVVGTRSTLLGATPPRRTTGGTKPRP